MLSLSGAELGPDLGPSHPVAVCFSPPQMAQWRSPNQSPGERDTLVVRPWEEKASEEGQECSVIQWAWARGCGRHRPPCMVVQVVYCTRVSPRKREGLQSTSRSITNCVPRHVKHCVHPEKRGGLVVALDG